MKKSLIVALALALAIPAQAASFSSGRSFSSSRSFSAPSRSYWSPKPSVPTTAPKVAPAPAPQVKQNVTIKRTTVVQQSTVQRSSSGGGWMQSIVGGVVGYGIGQWLFGPKPQPAPAQQVVDCSRNPLPQEWVEPCKTAR